MWSESKSVVWSPKPFQIVTNDTEFFAGACLFFQFATESPPCPLSWKSGGSMIHAADSAEASTVVFISKRRNSRSHYGHLNFLVSPNFTKTHIRDRQPCTDVATALSDPALLLPQARLDIARTRL